MTQVYIDVETTGLDPRTDHLLEVGVMVVDDDNIVIGRNNWVLWFNPDRVHELDPIVQKMHTENGLFAECAQSELVNTSYAQIAEMILDWLGDFALDLKTIPLTGNTVSFDRGFLREFLPEVNDAFHYRVEDISSIKIFLTKEYDLHENYFKGNRPVLPSDIGYTRLLADSNHRVFRCLWESFQDYQTCRDLVS